ncbi:hypothetical protein [Bacillus sp. NTK034]|uniref:hypothetical protein n=1 Tax=Bacillus sp. NTK034 TaxID=2802176 RepID=UPI001A8CB6B1|nr:hypothetical protein [Bacillus sp. NTK034]MBN8201817.1 hypothetical protein [Bacillus sp. NTK034]
MRNILFYTLAKFVPVLVGILLVPLLVKSLDPTEYGAYYSLNQLFNMLNTILLASTMYLQNHYLEKPQLLSVIQMSTLLIASGLAIIGSFLFYIFFQDFGLNITVLLLFNLVLFGIYQNKMIILNVSGNALHYSGGQIIFSLLKLLFIVLFFAFLPKNFEFVFIGQFISLFIIICYLEFLNKSFKRIPFKEVRYYTIKVLGFGIILSIIASSDMVLNFINILFANQNFNKTQLGIYSANFSILNMLVVLPPSILYLPFISKIYTEKKRNNYQGVKILFKQLYIFSFILIISILVFLYYFGEIIIHVAASKSHTENYIDYYLLTFGFALFSFSKIEMLKSQIFNTNKKFLLFIFLFVLIFTIVVSAFLFGLYQLRGAVISNSLGYLILYLLLVLVNKNIIYTRGKSRENN